MVKCEWDDEKNRLNLAKHQLDFETAQHVFRDIYAFEQEERSMAYGEVRLMITGLIGDRLVTVIYTERSDSYRIISARKASPNERKDYEENRGFAG